MICLTSLLIFVLINGVLTGFPKNSSFTNVELISNNTTPTTSTPPSTKYCPCNFEKPTTEILPTKLNNFDNKVFRLPNSVWPLEYNLFIIFDFNELKRFSSGKVFGNVSIYITIKNVTNVIMLHSSENMVIQQVTVKNVKTDQKSNLAKSYNITKSYVIEINLIANATIGETYVIEITFETHHLFNQESGILSRKYQTSTGKMEQMLATQFQPESARTVFPCFDEPRFKTTFQLSLTTNAEYSILNNMPELYCKNTTDSNNSVWKTCNFETSPLMPVYNLAFAIVDFKFIEKMDTKGRTFRIWARESEISKAHFALNTTIEAFRLFEETLKIDFPLKKVDSLAIPNLKGFLGMEHYGLITYDEPVIIWNDKFPISFSKSLCVSIICHEVAHQWFGNLVTTAWWKNLWLNEGFATFYSFIMTKKILKDDTFFILEKISTFNYVRNFDDYFALTKSTISAPVFSYVEAKFDYLSYKKGFIIVSMLEKLLGSQLFSQAVTHYLSNEKHSSVIPADLWRNFNQLSKIPFEDIMDEWLNKVCYPIVYVNLSNKTTINVKQNASINFKTTKFKIKVKDFMTDQWKIPLYIMFGNNSFRSDPTWTQFETSSDSLTLKEFNSTDDWLIINYNINSFFATDYDDVLFERLSKQMLTNHSVIPSLNRAQIMQDFYDLSKKFQRNDLEKLLKLFTYINQESDPVPLSTAVTLLDKLNGLFEMRTFYLLWRKYVTRVLKPTLKRLVNDFLNNFQGKKPTYVTLRRSLLNIACKLKLKYCFKITSLLIERWINNTLLETDYDLLHIALCKYIEMDDQGDRWQDLYNNTQFQSWDYINIKYYAMGCSKVPWIIEKNIDIAYNVLKNVSYRTDSPHVYPINIDNIPPDYLLGTTSLSNLLLLSSIYNTPNTLNFLFRFKKDGFNLLYNFLQYPPHFPMPGSILEYAVPTLSHYNFIIDNSQKDKSKNVIFRDAKANIDWILKNENLQEKLENIMYI